MNKLDRILRLMIPDSPDKERIVQGALDALRNGHEVRMAVDGVEVILKPLK